MRRTLLLLFAPWMLLDATAQERSDAKPSHTAAPGIFFGAGIGLDHGGLGLRMDALLNESIGVFAGGGYNLATVGWNAGLIYRHPSSRTYRPYAIGMYGYNLAVKWGYPYGSTGVNYYGPTFGGGVEMWSHRHTNFVHIGLLVPVRSKEARNVFDRLTPRPWPVLFSCGYHF